MMTLETALAELEALGTTQNRKIYRRHGVAENMYGVSYANLGALKKRIKTNHSLAQQLWATGNHDAQLLATMVADPGRMDAEASEAWARAISDYIVADALAKLVSAGPDARALTERWAASDDERVARAGLHLLALLAIQDVSLPDSFFTPYLERIEREIHGQKNRIKEAMNNALIAIGTRNEAMEARAIAAAERIGPVEVDHGETNCKTPAAVPYIRKARARIRAKEAAHAAR